MLIIGGDTQPNAAGLNHNMFGNLPGLQYPPSKQCQIYTQDRNARLYIRSGGRFSADLRKPNNEICTELACKTSDNNSGYYTAGPALEGTVCGKDYYCIKSECIHLSERQIQDIIADARGDQPQVATLPPEPPEEVGLESAQWSNWSSWSACESTCILHAKGSKKRKRICNIPRHLKDLSKSSCLGSPYEVQLCDYNCRAVKPADSFADVECQKYMSAKRRLNRYGFHD